MPKRTHQIILTTIMAITLIYSHLCSSSRFFELDGTWHFWSENQPNISGHAKVPGDIYADLFANGFIKFWNDPLWGRGDDTNRWVARHKWTYEKKFELPDEVHKANFVLLHLFGVDSPASVLLNNRSIVFPQQKLDNQFVSHSVDVWSDILPHQNVLRIEFESPVDEAKLRAEMYTVLHGHRLPPECTPPVYNGECHVQFLRKMQASFGWDWGPSFPTVGFWRPIRLEYFDRLTIRHFSPLVSLGKDGRHFVISVRLSLVCANGIQIRIKLRLTELKLDKEFGVLSSSNKCPNWELDSHLLDMQIPTDAVQLWHPIGYGAQSMYTLEIQIMENESQQMLAFDRKRIAFRTVRLNQQLVDPSNATRGRLFQFEVNGVPIFLKGTNWVPISLFMGRDHSKRRAFTLFSALKANANVLRVWGGGFYELDEFYEQTDEFGFLFIFGGFFVDFMFACALYPIDARFLRSVEAEIEEQVLRLRHHPSLLCWAANNENELAVRSQWYPSWDYPETDQARDYVKLYKKHIQTLAKKLDPTRPFLLSSPSNGIETKREGGVAQNPDDSAFGDVHFYAETVNLWKPSNLPVPRCASEFGVQSMPLRGTMIRWIDPADWAYESETLVQRQHHPGGVLTLLAMVSQHFGIVKANRSSFFIDQFSFLSQIHQAVALQTQIEHYRRFRSHLNDAGLGHTMCAMYWQLNDVWAAPTWSTVDFDMRWKISHHFVRRSFAPLIISMFLDSDGTFRLWTVSDLSSPVQNVVVRLSLFPLRSGGFLPLFTANISVPTISPFSSQEILLPDWPPIAFARHFSSYDEGNFLLVADLVSTRGHCLSSRAVLYPNKMLNAGRYGSAAVSALKEDEHKNGTAFSVQITVSDNVLPLLWLDLSDSFKNANPEVLFYFEVIKQRENAFPSVSRRHLSTLRIVSNPKGAKISKESIVLTVL